MIHGRSVQVAERGLGPGAPVIHLRPQFPSVRHGVAVRWQIRERSRGLARIAVRKLEAGQEYAAPRLERHPSHLSRLLEAPDNLLAAALRLAAQPVDQPEIGERLDTLCFRQVVSPQRGRAGELAPRFSEVA